MLSGRPGRRSGASLGMGGSHPKHQPIRMGFSLCSHPRNHLRPASLPSSSGTQQWPVSLIHGNFVHGQQRGNFRGEIQPRAFLAYHPKGFPGPKEKQLLHRTQMARHRWDLPSLLLLLSASLPLGDAWLLASLPRTHFCSPSLCSAPCPATLPNTD